MPGTLPLNPVFGRTLSLVIMWNRERFSAFQDPNGQAVSVSTGVVPA